MSTSLRAQLSIDSGGEPVTMAGFDTARPAASPRRKGAEHELSDVLLPRLAALHDMLMANRDRSVLLVLQGLDTSGKSGTIKHIVSAFNPVGVRVASFAEPEGEETQEPFLARIERSLPDSGQIGVFDRSHYEDAIVPRALEGMTDDDFSKRIDQILDFESRLVDDGFVIVKCFLHIGYEEQRQRFLRRLDRPDKRWKFSEADLDTRRHWPAFQAACGEVIGLTSTDTARWHVVPADQKWYRNWAIASLLVEHLEALDLNYPDLDPAIDPKAARARLATRS